MSFGYDGFGNRTTQAVTKGSAPTSYLNYDGNNRIVGSGFGYDANGNMTQMPGVTGTMTYDVANRLKTVAGETYTYGPDNRRVLKRTASGVESLTVWGIDGHRAGELWFAGRPLWADDGKMTFTDRLGSVRLRVYAANAPTVTAERHGYYPYGEEQTATAGNRTKYGTYARDAATGLDYADQRYYGSGVGRFLTVDAGPASPGNPTSWNRFGYTWGDPVNMNDPDGALPIKLDAGPGGTSDPSPGYIPNAAFFLQSWWRTYDVSEYTYGGYDWRNAMERSAFPDFARPGDTRKVETAYLNAEKRASDPDCDKTLVEKGIDSLASLVRRYNPGANLFDGRRSDLIIPDGKNKTVRDYLAPNNAGAAVISGIATPTGKATFLAQFFFSGTDDVGRSLILLHEAVHQFGDKGDAYFGGSKELSELLIQNCFKDQIDRLGAFRP